MLTIMKYIIIYSIILFFLGSCSFLEEYSQDTVQVRGYEDLEELLIGEGYMKVNGSYSLEQVASYYPYLHYMSDETEECEKSDFGSSGFNRRDAIFGYYTWQDRCGVNEYGSSFADESGDWTKLYYHVNIVNSVIDLIDEYIKGGDNEVAEANRVKGEAYFLRGAYYFTLINLYGKPYEISTAENDLGVPLKLTGEIQDVIFQRESVARVYEQIESDLKIAEDCLGKANLLGTIYQADSTAVHLLMSRFYLYKQDWKQALKYARKVIAVKPDLLDLNGFSGGFLSKSSVETIFSMGGHAITHNTVNQYKSFQVSREMYDTYDITDLRKSVFFWTYNDFVGYAKIAESSSFANDDPAVDYYYNYMLAYEGRKIEVSDNFLFRNAEAYLNGAEAAAYLGDEATALDLLEQLRVKRFKNESYATLQKSGEELVTEIREERRRELCLEGHRWFDLRRYMVCEKYPYSKEIEKVYYVYKDDSSDEKIEKRVYKLEKNDPAYVLPIPHEVLEFHTGMQNNPHPVRSYRIESLN